MSREYEIHEEHDVFRANVGMGALHAGHSSEDDCCVCVFAGLYFQLAIRGSNSIWDEEVVSFDKKDKGKSLQNLCMQHDCVCVTKGVYFGVVYYEDIWCADQKAKSSDSEE